MGKRIVNKDVIPVVAGTFLNLKDHQPDLLPANTIFEVSDFVLVKDKVHGVQRARIYRYLTDFNQPHLTAKKGDLLISTEADITLNDVIGWMPMPE